MPVKKRNPQDTTLRNTRAANKRLEALDARLDALERAIADLQAWVAARPKESSAVPE